MADLLPNLNGSPRPGGSSFSSTLSIAGYNAMLAAGLEPLGIVQGVCVMRWNWYGARSPYGGATPSPLSSKRLKHRYLEPTDGFTRNWRRTTSPVYSSKTITNWSCQHSTRRAGAHEPGVNFEQNWVEDLWSEAFAAARTRMIDEARMLGAHGVVGVVDTISDPTRGAKEFLLRGTAVRVNDAPAPLEVWSTYLAGERLVKLVEAGWAPVSVVAAMSSIRIWPACSTESQLSGWWPEVARIAQLESGHYSARFLARERVHAESGADDVHGVRFEVAENRITAGDDEVNCTVWGSRIRRFASPELARAPMATVPLR